MKLGADHRPHDRVDVEAEEARRPHSQCHNRVVDRAANQIDDLRRREADLARREAALAVHLNTADEILEAADVRDQEADARDVEAMEKDHAADRQAFTEPRDSAGYGADLPARRHAAMDRLLSEEDRHRASKDRSELAESIRDTGDLEGRGGSSS